jgi:hypothetical protein
MDPGVGCTLTHVLKVEGGEQVKRVFLGEEPEDWGSPCHDCNVTTGQPHHFGCDVERCPECGRQMIGCDCGWRLLAGPVQLTTL